MTDSGKVNYPRFIFNLLGIINMVIFQLETSLKHQLLVTVSFITQLVQFTDKVLAEYFVFVL